MSSDSALTIIRRNVLGDVLAQHILTHATAQHSAGHRRVEFEIKVTVEEKQTPGHVRICIGPLCFQYLQSETNGA